MEKQKVCIIGGGLTGLVTAAALSKLNFSCLLIYHFSILDYVSRILIGLFLGATSKNVRTSCGADMAERPNRSITIRAPIKLI